MKWIVSYKIFLLLLIFIEVNSKLVGVVEIFRHGSRAPPAFALKGKKKYFFDSSSMGLTINGFEQHLSLGTWIRKRYVEKYKLLSQNVTPSELELYSTATQRTIFSLTGHILGLYPGTKLIPNLNEIKEMKFNQGPPIDYEDTRPKLYYTIKNKMNPTLHSWKCKLNGKKLKNQVYPKSLYKFSKGLLLSMIEEFKNRMPFLFKKTKYLRLSKLIKIIIGYVRCVNFLTGRNTFGISEKFIHLLRIYVVDKWYSYSLNKINEQYLKISVSKLFEDISNFFEKKSFNMETKKMILYSGHDTNLINIISNLINHEYLEKLAQDYIENKNEKSFYFLVPQFASNILFELHKINKKYYIRLIYNGKTLKENFISSEVKYIEDKGIELQSFLNMLKERINPDYKNLEC
jgi:hypothetical protein